MKFIRNEEEVMKERKEKIKRKGGDAQKREKGWQRTKHVTKNKLTRRKKGMLRKKQRNILLCCLAAILAGAIALLSCGFTATKAEEGKTYLTYAADNGM